jgi:hypothetical protein
LRNGYGHVFIGRVLADGDGDRGRAGEAEEERKRPLAEQKCVRAFLLTWQ